VADVSLEHITKRFSAGAAAVDDLTLHVRDGELMVLLGPSGCGKTTGLRMVAGLERPDRGDIRIGGRRVNDLEPKDRDVALVFQSYALYPHMTARGNLLYPLKALQQQLGTTTIFVTHDQAEAMTMADRIAIMDRGALQNEVIVNVHVGQSLIKVRAQPSMRPARGETVYLTADPARLHLFGADGRRLNG
jgi:multiple sugar transport system ATP-binding protein